MRKLLLNDLNDLISFKWSQWCPLPKIGHFLDIKNQFLFQCVTHRSGGGNLKRPHQLTFGGQRSIKLTLLSFNDFETNMAAPQPKKAKPSIDVNYLILHTDYEKNIFPLNEHKVLISVSKNKSKCNVCCFLNHAFSFGKIGCSSSKVEEKQHYPKNRRIWFHKS